MGKGRGGHLLVRMFALMIRVRIPLRSIVFFSKNGACKEQKSENWQEFDPFKNVMM